MDIPAEVIVSVLAASLRRWYIFRGWHSWPSAEATVETAEAYFVDIGYSYAVNGSYTSGWEQRTFSSR